MQRYGKICTNTRKQTKKFTLSLFLARFFASITVTTPLALGYHPEDARRVKDVLGISSVLRCRYIYCFCIPLVYLWYSSSHLPLLRSPILSILPAKKARAFLPAPKHNSKFLIHNYSTSPVPSRYRSCHLARCTLDHCEGVFALDSQGWYIPLQKLECLPRRWLGW